jgi:hypothetical protein
MNKKRFIEFYDAKGQKIIGIPAIRTIKPNRENILAIFRATPEIAYATLNGYRYTALNIYAGQHGTKEA